MVRGASVRTNHKLGRNRRAQQALKNVSIYRANKFRPVPSLATVANVWRRLLGFLSKGFGLDFRVGLVDGSVSKPDLWYYEGTHRWLVLSDEGITNKAC